MTNWKSPRCGQACWDEIRQHNARYEALFQKLADVIADRDEWKQQHENLLAIYQASLIPNEPQAARRFDHDGQTCPTCGRIGNGEG